MWNSHCDTQHPVRADRGTGDGAMRLTEWQHLDRGLAVDETHRRHSRATETGLHGMGNGGRDSTPRGDLNRLE